MLAGLGYELDHHAVVVARTISRYGLWISLALIAVIIVAQVRSRRHMMRVAGQASPNGQARAGEASAAPAAGDETAS